MEGPPAAGARALGVLYPSQIFLYWKPRAIGAIWVQMAEEALQYLSEVSKVGMFVGLKQPTNLRDERGLDRMGVNFVVRVRQLVTEALEKVIHG